MSNSLKISTVTPDLYALDSILPAHLRDNEKFKEFIEAYLEWQQDGENSPGRLINTLIQTRDIDRIADSFLQHLQHEVALPIENIANIDKRKLYKQLTDLYLSKGSIPSYQALFNLLFKDSIELYFPRVDILKLSEGNWDNVAKRYTDTNGFLSDRKYLQDSYYYQDYSYVIKTSKSLESWKDIVTRILHPAGFKFFGQIKITSIASIAALKTPINQPGHMAASVAARPLISDPVLVRMKVVGSYRHIRDANTLHPFAEQTIVAFGPTLLHLEQTKFGLFDTLDQYENIVLQDTTIIPAKTLKTNVMPGSLNLGVGAGYADSTTTITRFTAAQPADLSNDFTNDLIDLAEPSSTTVELDLQ